MDESDLEDEKHCDPIISILAEILRADDDEKV
jgi:hypothetical protein